MLPARPLTPPERIELRDDLPDRLCAVPEVGAERAAEERWLDQMEQGDFLHLNQTRRLVTDGEVDWLLGPISQDRLWTVTLHYHGWAERLARLAAGEDELSRRADAVLRRHISDWMMRCDLEAPGARELAWNAYAVATRIGHWVRAWHLLESVGAGAADGHGLTAPGELRESFLRSLWRQAAFLKRNLEWDLRANHLLRDAVGLAWAGRFFAGSDARRWLATATKLAVQQAREQVLADGGHFERSPMYHLHVMEDFAALACLVDDADAAFELRDTWRKMAECAAWARHPDGGIPLLNDAALNGAESPDHILRQGGQLLDIALSVSPRTGSRHFAEFGLAVHHDPAWSVFFDVGPVGVDYQPGHAHADTLTLEASYRGRRLIVDPGTYGYDRDGRRSYDRSTAAHNTVCIDGENSSEVWHIFRVGRRARPRDVSVATAGDTFRAAASHDGYRHLPGRPIHRREVAVTPQGHLNIVDTVGGRGEHQITAGLLIAPGWKIERADPAQWRLTLDDRTLTLRFTSEQAIDCADDFAASHPEFGREHTVRRLTWRYRGPLPVRVQTLIEPSHLPASLVRHAEKLTTA